MQLTQTFLGWLNRVFDKDAHSFQAFSLNHKGGAQWSIADQVMTVTFPTDAAADFTIDLTQYTVGTLITHLSSLTGLQVTGPNSHANFGLSAVVLQDGSGTQGQWVVGYTNLLWVWLDAVAEQMQLLAIQVANAPNEMSTTTADGGWLDYIGDYFEVTRNQGELDGQYGPRIPATVVRPLSNNVAIEVILEDLTGYACTVDDVVIYGPAVPAFNGAYNFDGSQIYNANPAPIYGLFDVNFSGTGLSGAAAAALQASVASTVAPLRAGGTHLRNVNINS